MSRKGRDEPMLGEPGYEIGRVVESACTLTVSEGVRRGARGFRRLVSLVGPGTDRIRDPAFARDLADVALACAVTASPGVLAVEDVAELAGISYAVTARLDGGLLAPFLDEPGSRRRAWSTVAACETVLRLAEAAMALGRALPNGGALGAISPESVWVPNRGAPILLPNAVSRVSCKAGAAADGPRRALRYRAPELRRGEPADERADVYSLAVLLWDLLMAGSVASGQPLGASRTPNEPIHTGAVRLVVRSLSPDRCERPGSVEEFRSELASVAPDRDDARAAWSKPPPIAPGPGISGTGVHPRGAVRPGAAVRLRVVGDSRGVVLCGENRARRWVVGRAPLSDLVVFDPDVSREHFEIVRAADGSHRIYDLGSKNGVFVNGRPGDGRVLGVGDEVRIGTTVLRLERPE